MPHTMQRLSRLYPTSFSLVCKTLVVMTTMLSCSSAAPVHSLNDEVDYHTDPRAAPVYSLRDEVDHQTDGRCAYDFLPHERVITFCQNTGVSYVLPVSPKTTALDLHSNQFPDIDKRTLQNADSLTLDELDMSDVHAKTISPDVFDSHMGAHLKRFKFANNELESLDMIRSAVIFAKQLVFLDIRNSTLIPYTIKEYEEFRATLQHLEIVCDFDDCHTRPTTETFIDDKTKVTVQASVTEHRTTTQLTTTPEVLPTPSLATTPQRTTRDDIVLAVGISLSVLLMLGLVGGGIWIYKKVHRRGSFTPEQDFPQLLKAEQLQEGE